MRDAIQNRSEFELRGTEELCDPDDLETPIGKVKWKFIVSDLRPLPKKVIFSSQSFLRTFVQKKKQKVIEQSPIPEPEVDEKPEEGILDILNMEQPTKATPPPQDEPDQVIFVDDNELSKSGRRELEIMVHCATNIYKVGTKELVKTTVI